jgi:streptogramin lyase
MRTLLAMMLLGCLVRPTAAGVIDTLAGTGESGYAGDGGQATAARLHQPFHCALDGDGHLYIADNFNHCIRRIALKTGVITTVAGTGGKKGYSGDGGPATKATFNEPYAIAIGPKGDLYIVDRLNAAVRHVKADSGVITTLAGTGKPGRSGDGSKANEAALVEPNDCCLDGKGGLLIADVGDGRIRRVDLRSSKIATFAGTAPPRGKVNRRAIGDGGPADKAVIVGARAVCVDGKGNTYICEREGNAVRKVDAKGIITTLAGTGARGTADGPADRASFNGPKAIRCDAAGNLYIADTENNSIRRIDIQTLRVTTVAGGREGGRGDGGDARKAELNRPHGCILDGDGILYIADSSNHRVRRVKP